MILIKETQTFLLTVPIKLVNVKGVPTIAQVNFVDTYNQIVFVINMLLLLISASNSPIKKVKKPHPTHHAMSKAYDNYNWDIGVRI